ncbi:hypothetical protein ACWDSF_06180 [Nocardia beijingensis]
MNPFHIHSWSKWEAIQVRRMTIWSAPKDYVVDVQERRCTKCGRIQRDEIT